MLRWIVMIVGYFFSFSYSSDNSLSPSFVGCLSCLHVKCTCLIGFAIISVCMKERCGTHVAIVNRS